MIGEVAFPAWDPVLLRLGPLQIRWYGLMYVVGFLVGQWILVRLARARFFPLPEKRAGDLIFWLLFGVLLGGRLGYVAFYHPEYVRDPLQLIAIWEGGLSFHGGLIGVFLVMLLFARKHRVSPWRVSDCLALAVTPGIFAVRLSNFINGELYGRTTDASVPWAMRFPTEPRALELMGIPETTMRERELQMLAAIASGKWDTVKAQVPLRHPSQLYEALGEGVILGLLLLAVYLATRARPLGRGVFGGLFLLGYGAVRFVVEFFREPDAHLGFVMGPFSRGQQLCFLMIVAGGALIAYGWRRREPLPAGAAGG